MKLYFEDLQVGEIKIPAEAAPYFEYAVDWMTLADAFPL